VGGAYSGRYHAKGVQIASQRQGHTHALHQDQQKMSDVFQLEAAGSALEFPELYNVSRLQRYVLGCQDRDLNTVILIAYFDSQAAITTKRGKPSEAERAHTDDMASKARKLRAHETLFDKLLDQLLGEGAEASQGSAQGSVPKRRAEC